MDKTWKDSFREQTDSGKYWKELFKTEFESHKFLDRSDAVYICKKAQSDAYYNVIEKLKSEVDNSIIEKIEEIITNLWNEDDSALGMISPNGQIY